MPSRLLLCATGMTCDWVGKLARSWRTLEIPGRSTGAMKTDAHTRSRITPLQSGNDCRAQRAPASPTKWPAWLPSRLARGGRHTVQPSSISVRAQMRQHPATDGMQDSSDRGMTASCGKLRSFCRKLRGRELFVASQRSMICSRIGARRASRRFCWRTAMPSASMASIRSSTRALKSLRVRFSPL